MDSVGRSVGRGTGWGALASLFFVEYLLTWLVWGSAIAEANDVLSFRIPQGVALWMLLIGVMTVAAVTGGMPALRDLAARVLRWRVRWVWYAIAALLPIGLAAAAMAVANLLGADVPTGVDEPLGAAVGYFAFGILLFGLTEELAWRGFALPRLQAHMTPLASAAVLGILWAVWHTPLFLIAGAHQDGWPYLAFVVLVLAESVLITWVFNHARGSVLLVAIFHAASDAALAYSGVLYGSDLAFWVAVLVYVAAAVAVIGARPAEWTSPTARVSEAVYPPV
jgi:hypothetical protein